MPGNQPVLHPPLQYVTLLLLLWGFLTTASEDDFEASVMSDSYLDRKPRKRSMNLAVGLEDLYKGGTKKLKV